MPVRYAQSAARAERRPMPETLEKESPDALRGEDMERQREHQGTGSKELKSREQPPTPLKRAAGLARTYVESCTGHLLVGLGRILHRTTIS